MIVVRCPYCGAELHFQIGGSQRRLALFCAYCGTEWIEEVDGDAR